VDDSRLLQYGTSGRPLVFWDPNTLKFTTPVYPDAAHYWYFSENENITKLLAADDPTPAYVVTLDADFSVKYSNANIFSTAGTAGTAGTSGLSYGTSGTSGTSGGSAYIGGVSPNIPNGTTDVTIYDGSGVPTVVQIPNGSIGLPGAAGTAGTAGISYASPGVDVLINNTTTAGNTIAIGAGDNRIIFDVDAATYVATPFTMALPNTPVDGQRIEFIVEGSTASNGVAFTFSGGTTTLAAVNSPVTLYDNQFCEVVYCSNTAKWVVKL
jgi:hypothetical protein